LTVEIDDSDLADEGATGSGKGKRLPKETWKEIFRLRLEDEMDVNDMSAKFGVSTTAISAMFKRHGIEKGAAKRERLAKAAEEKAKAAAAAPPAEDTWETKKKRRTDMSKEATFLLSNKNTRLAVKIQQKLERAIDVTPDDQVEGLVKTLFKLESFIEKAKNNQYDVLDVRTQIDQAAIPVLQIEDLSDREIEDMQARGLDEDDDDDGEELDIELTEEGIK
jgi:hypothetical protein